MQLALDLGLNNVVETARQMEVTAPVDPYPATAIGGLGTGVSALGMASAYSTFAATGIHREPYALKQAERLSFGGSEPVYDHKVEGDHVLSRNQAAAANEALRGGVRSGTVNLYYDLDSEIGRPSAGKIGTTDDFVDAWYVGYTPRLATAVWAGYPEGRAPMRNVHGESAVSCERLPIDIWSTYMAKATAEDSGVGFSRPHRGKFVPLNRVYAANLALALSGAAATHVTLPPHEGLYDV